MEKSFFKQKIGQQTISGVVTVSALPFLYIGGVNHINGLLIFGMALIIIGMTSAPLITYFHGWNTDGTVESQGE